MGELAVKLDAFLLLYNMCPATKDGLFQSKHMRGHQLLCQYQYHGALRDFVRPLTIKTAGDCSFTGNLYRGTSAAAICSSE